MSSDRICKRLNCGATGATRIEFTTSAGLKLATFLCPRCRIVWESGRKEINLLGAVEIEKPSNAGEVVEIAERRRQKREAKNDKPDKEPA